MKGYNKGLYIGVFTAEDGAREGFFTAEDAENAAAVPEFIEGGP